MMNGKGPWPFRQTPTNICEMRADGVRMCSGMTTVRPEAEGTVAAGQPPVKLGTRSFDENAPVGGVAAGEAGAAEGPAAEAPEEAAPEEAPEPVQDASRSSGTVMAAAHRRRRRPVRGVDIVLPL